MLFVKSRLIIHSLLLVALLAGFAGATITVNATISTYAAFASQNAGATPGLLIFMESSTNDYNYAAGAQWITIDQNKTYTFTLPSAGYYWTGFNNNSSMQASNCTVSGLNGITGSGTYIADGTTVTMTITCTEPDVTPPVISSAVVNSTGTTLTLTYNESVASSYAAASEFIITAGGSAVSVTNVTYSGSTVMLDLGSTIGKNQTVTVSFDNSGEELVDDSWNAAESLTNYVVTNNSTEIILVPQTITFANPGSQNFGTTPTLSASSTSTLTVEFTSSSTNVCTVTSAGALTFLTTGTCTINADQAGNASYAAATTVTRSFAVNAVAPGAPTIGTATAGDTQATISFTAPASNGGATITLYTVTSNPGNITASGAASPLTVTGLTNGTSYTFTVAATNSAGTSATSAASNAVTPKGTQTITFATFTDVTYGDADFAPDAEASSGLSLSFTSDNEAVAKITTTGFVQITGAGNATITASQAGNSAYETAASVSRDLSVLKAPLTITAENDSITQGESDPVFQFIFDGFVNGDDSSDLTDLTATRNPGTTAGDYTITPGASSTNYDIDFVNGTLTILEGTTSIVNLGLPNVSVHPVQGGLFLTGLRGNLEIFTLRGEQVQSIQVNRDGVYAVNLKAGHYVLRLGPSTWTLSPSLDR